MKWLHISDIHFGSSTGTDKEEGKSKTMRKRFLEYLETAKIRATELFITGDLGFGPDIARQVNDEQRQIIAQKSASFIREVAKQIGIKESDINSRVHIVPGNHDLIRDRNRKRCIVTVNQEYGEMRPKEQDLYRFISDDVKALSGGFSYFCMVLEGLYGPNETEKIKDEMSRMVHRWVSLQSAKLNLLCLNTAILSGLGKEGNRDLELHDLLIDTNRIEDLLIEIKENNPNPIIIMGHHYDSYLKDEERLRFRHCCQRNGVQLILCGHAHIPFIDDGNNPRQLVTGCFKDNSGEETASFYVGNYKEHSRIVTFTTHVWENDTWCTSNSRRADPVKLKSVPLEVKDDTDYIDFDSTEAEKKRIRRYSLAKATEKYAAYLKKQTADDALKYLRQGITNDSEEYGLTPQLFYKRFYVKPKPEEDDRLFDMINMLFGDTSHNMLCIKSTAGTGKTTLIRTLECRVDRNTNYRKFRFHYHTLDCLNNSGLHAFPFTDLHRRFRKEFSDMCKKRAWYESFVSALDYLVIIETKRSIDDPDLERFIGNLKDFRNALYTGTHSNKKPPTFNNHASQVNKAFERIRANRRESAALFLLVLVLACKKSSGEDGTNVKNILVFDNIETYTNSVAMEVGRKFHSAIRMAEKCFDLIESILHVAFKMDFTFIFCVRPVTNFSLFPRQEFGESFGPNDRYIYTWEFFDFTLEAMLKKLKFLKENAIENDFFSAVRNIIQIVVPEQVVEHYLNTGELTDSEADDVLSFSRRVLLPFFNNNYKNALMKIISLDRDWLAKVLMFLNDPKFSTLKPEARNMAHMILFKHVFDEFIDKGIFKEFKISHIIRGGNNHSFSRVLLAYIYWNTEGANTTRKGITVRELIDAFPSKSVTTIIDTLCSLSIYMKSKEDDSKSHAIKEWGELIELKGIQNALTIKSDISDPTRQTEIEVKLSPIGRCFVVDISNWFEYFSARLLPVNKKPLSLYSCCNLDVFNSDNFEDIISEVIKALRKCAITLQKSVASCCCKECSRPRREQEKKAPGDCMAFVFRQELCASIRVSIDYIDRFRRVYFCCHKDKKSNDCLLGKIKELNALYEYARTTDEHPRSYPYTLKHDPPYYHRRHDIPLEKFDNLVDMIGDQMKQGSICATRGLYDLLEECLLKQGVFSEG